MLIHKFLQKGTHNHHAVKPKSTKASLPTQNHIIVGSNFSSKRASKENSEVALHIDKRTGGGSAKEMYSEMKQFISQFHRQGASTPMQAYDQATTAAQRQSDHNFDVQTLKGGTAGMAGRGTRSTMTGSNTTISGNSGNSLGSQTGTQGQK